MRGTWDASLGAFRDFLRAWRERPRADYASDQGRDLFVAGYCLVTVGIIALLFDSRAAYGARGLNPLWYWGFEYVTGFGKSAYLFVLTGFTAIASATLSQAVRNGTLASVWALVAGRAFYLFVTLAVSGLASQLLKRVGRARPKFVDQGGAFQFDPLMLKSSWSSFPSGHTITAFAIATALGYLVPRWRWPLLVAAALIGASRIVLGAHYPSDVAAGACIGAASAILLRRLFASRRIVFAVRDRKIVPRAQGAIWPALRGVMRERAKDSIR
ncbi:MAG: phosphatase PAP2 family protein [Beijerinckiaceae bacterium]